MVQPANLQRSNTQFFLERTAKALPRFILEEKNKTRVYSVF
jgi:hypothetical protein